MIPKALDERALVALVQAGAAIELLVTRTSPEGAYSASARIGVRWVPLRSQRDPVRTWKSLDALVSFSDKIGIQRLSVEL
jgi:hypothetical protein|tara:strand:+ start:2814 stop:3053 length:240 start_codon:yes stop_codon:yes gene_type:complete